MTKIAAGLAMAALAATAQAETIGFDGDRAGAAPAGWLCGSTGGGTPRWTIEPDAGAPTPPNVLKQSGKGDFPWCIRQGTMLADGAVDVKFKPLAGREDQAGGVVWRWKDGDNYYVARANALENNVSLYYTGAAAVGPSSTSMPRSRETPGTRSVLSSTACTFVSCWTASCTSRSMTAISPDPERSVSGPRPTASRPSTISAISRRRKVGGAAIVRP